MTPEETRGPLSGPDSSVYSAKESAKDLYQAFLDRIDRAFWARDWDGTLRCFQVPHRLCGPDIDRTVESDAEFLTLLQAARDNLSASGTTEYHRIAKEARFETSKRLTGRHVTYVLRGGSLMMPPQNGYATFEKTGDGWKSVLLRSDKPEARLPLFHADKIRITPHKTPPKD